MRVDDMLLHKYKKELDYILTSTSENRDNEVIRDRLVKSIVQSFHRKGLEVSCIEDSPHYRLARILKDESINDWVKFKKVVAKTITEHKVNPRNALGLCSLKWKTRFSIPEIRSYSKRRSKEVVAADTSRTVPVDALHTIIERIDVYEKNVKSILNALANHIHINDKCYVIHEINGDINGRSINEEKR